MANCTVSKPDTEGGLRVLYKSSGEYLRPSKGWGESGGKASTSSSVFYITGVMHNLAQTVKAYTYHLAHIKLHEARTW